MLSPVMGDGMVRVKEDRINPQRVRLKSVAGICTCLNVLGSHVIRFVSCYKFTLYIVAG